MPGPLNFLTLGPAGSNHDVVTQRYLEFHRLRDATITFISDFHAGLGMMAADAADFMIQAAVHPDCSDIVAKAHFAYGIRIVDTFISPSKDLAILTRSAVDRPRSLGLQPATKGYADLTSWEELIPEPTTVAVAEGLRAGSYDSGITAREFAELYPGEFRIEKVIGTVDDPWLVFGKTRVSDGGIVAWPDSPAAGQFKP